MCPQTSLRGLPLLRALLMHTWWLHRSLDASSDSLGGRSRDRLGVRGRHRATKPAACVCACTGGTLPVVEVL